jgi:hypothetical protein
VQGHSLPFNQARGTLHSIGGGSVLKCFNLQAIVFIRLARTNVQFVYVPHLITCKGGDAMFQSLAHQFGKELVIAVPAPLVVQRNEEQVGSFEIF